MLKFERDLRAAIEKLRDQLSETRRELHLNPENVQKVVEVALEVAGQPLLIPSKLEGVWPDPTRKRKECPVFDLPAFTQPSWRHCAEGLRQPHTNKLRPIVFDHGLADGRDDVVLAHLNHRLVQMSLGLLRAEVWATEGKKKLNRITARIVPDTALRDPAMIAHARLVVIGGDCHRLHEEIISAGGLLTGGKFSRLNVGQTKDALAAGTADEPSDSMKRILLKLYKEHHEALVKALETRMKDRKDGLAKFLAEREAKEIEDIRSILTELKRTIEAELSDSGLQQMTFQGWTDPEREQLERNMSALRAKAVEIPKEIERETQAIKARFAGPQPRMFPVAVTFLVPAMLSQA
jgi:hypothetical protein